MCARRSPVVGSTIWNSSSMPMPNSDSLSAIVSLPDTLLLFRFHDHRAGDGPGAGGDVEQRLGREPGQDAVRVAVVDVGVGVGRQLRDLDATVVGDVGEGFFFEDDLLLYHKRLAQR